MHKVLFEVIYLFISEIWVMLCHAIEMGRALQRKYQLPIITITIASFSMIMAIFFTQYWFKTVVTNSYFVTFASSKIIFNLPGETYFILTTITLLCS